MNDVAAISPLGPSTYGFSVPTMRSGMFANIPANISDSSLLRLIVAEFGNVTRIERWNDCGCVMHTRSHYILMR